MTDKNSEQHMIADIKRLLDAHTLDVDTRTSLQKARIRALTGTESSWSRRPWPELAFAVSVMAVVAIYLPQIKTVEPEATRPSLVNKPTTIVSKNTIPISPTVKTDRALTKTPSISPIAKQVQTIDMDLLENLDLYQDAEFYEWLSELEDQGEIDA